MPTFQYTARDREGNQANGTLSAESERALRESLRSQNLFLTKYRVEESTSSVGNEQQGLFGPKKVKLGDMVVMSRQLATLVRAGIPILEALNTTAAQSENPTLISALRQVRLDVMTGNTLAYSLRQHPKVFNELYCSLVEAGETGGILEHTLEVAAVQFDKEAELREKIKAAMTYPVIVIIASIGVVTFMLLFIVPTFAKVYTQFDAQLPLITQSLIWLSDLLLHYAWAVILLLIGVFLACKRWYQTEQGRRFFDQVKLKLPLLGKLFRKIAISRFTQTWSGMTEGGVPIMRGLAVSANTAGNVIVRDSIATVMASVQEGGTLAQPLEASGQFPPLVTRMVSAGEESGNLPEMLREITKFYERDIEYTVNRITKLMEPIMTVIVGGIVLFVLLSLYYPIFNLTKVIKR